MDGQALERLAVFYVCQLWNVNRRPAYYVHYMDFYVKN